MADGPLAGSLHCSECNLCSLVSCPEELDPKQVCVSDKAAAREKGMKWSGDPAGLRPHGLYGFRRTPMKRLMARLGLAYFRDEGPLKSEPVAASRVVIPLKQHAGTAADPVVKPGQRVAAGDLVGTIEEGKTGARVHASISGRVTAVNGSVTIVA
jgi:Na+-translocating ferredoxin:NAD+ oxidoreductase RnfC subunit